MIRQSFVLGHGYWRVKAYYLAKSEDADEILRELEEIGCVGVDLILSYFNLSSGKKNTGLTFSDNSRRASVLVISNTTSADEFWDSLDHEKGHLCRHIVRALRIDPFGEDAQYIAGSIAKQVAPVARYILCGC